MSLAFSSGVVAPLVSCAASCAGTPVTGTKRSGSRYRANSMLGTLDEGVSVTCFPFASTTCSRRGSSRDPKALTWPREETDDDTCWVGDYCAPILGRSVARRDEESAAEADYFCRGCPHVRNPDEQKPAGLGRQSRAHPAPRPVISSLTSLLRFTPAGAVHPAPSATSAGEGPSHRRSHSRARARCPRYRFHPRRPKADRSGRRG